MSNKKYQINYAVQSMLAVVGIVLLLIFYKMSYINTGLLTVIPGDLAQYIIFIGALIALVLLLLFELILLVISIKQTKKGEVSGFVKAARFVLPIVFVVSFIIVCLCAFGTTSAKNILDKEPSVVSQIKDYALKDSDKSISDNYYLTCEKNSLGKAGFIDCDKSYFDKYGNSCDVNFTCSLQESHSSLIKSKFEGYDKDDIVLKNKSDGDGYTLYYDSNEKGYAYSLLIENGDKLFYSKFSAEDVNDFEYSKEQFVSDSLSVFNDWNKF